jgi:hypothetical protein
MIFAPYYELRPFLSDSLENKRLTADDHGKLVPQAIEELKTQGVRVRSMIGDNFPAQIPAFAHWRPKSRLGSSNTFLNGIKYSPYRCHFMQLIVGDCISPVPGLQEFDEILQNLITLANASEVCGITRRRCPQFVKTRWLSRCEALHWLLGRQQMFLSIDRRNVQQSRRKKFQRTVTEENFEKLSICHRFLYPCTRAVKFFEQDRTSLCHVYPGLKALKRYFADQADTAEGESPELMEG